MVNFFLSILVLIFLREQIKLTNYNNHIKEVFCTEQKNWRNDICKQNIIKTSNKTDKNESVWHTKMVTNEKNPSKSISIKYNRYLKCCVNFVVTKGYKQT